MRTALALLLVATIATAEDPPHAWPEPAVDWFATPQAAGYDAATANDPRFEDTAVWPGLTGQERFVTQRWPAAKRTLVWAHPGESSNNVGKETKLKKGPHDPFAPASWRDAGGKPATEVEFDEETDVVFPSSDTPYCVNLAGRETMAKGLRQVFRHMTIGRNAKVPLGGDGPGRTWHGNLWVKRGGQTYGNGVGDFSGAGHTFVRNDNRDDNGMISQYFQMRKTGDASLEYCGRVIFLDEWKLVSGMVIVGPDSFCRPGRGAAPFVGKGASLVLLDGAYWGKWPNEWFHPVDLTVQEQGTLQAGLPERPLRRDATVALSFRNWGGLSFKEWVPKTGNYGHPDQTKVSAIFRRGSTIRTVAAAGSPARLVITRHLLDGHGGTADAREGRRSVTGIADMSEKSDRAYWTEEAFRTRFTSLPFRTLIFLDQDVTVDGVRFDHFPAGGIACADGAAHGAWQRVEYGPHNLAQGDALFRTIPAPDSSGIVPPPAR